MPPPVLWPYGDTAATVLAAAALAALVALAGVLHRRGVPARATRALVHAATGMAVAAMPFVFASATGPALLAAAFALANAWAIRRGRFAGLHAGVGDADRDAPSVGTVAFPVALLAGLVLVDPFGADESARAVWAVAFATLALADPAAAAVGRAWTRRHAGAAGKTAAGSVAFAGVAVAVAVVGMGTLTVWMGAEIVAFAAAAAVVGAACERAGRGGWDNLWIAAGLLVLGRAWTPEPVVWALPGLADVASFGVDGRIHVGVALAVGAAVGVLSRRARFLTADGALAAGLLAASLVAVGTWAHALSGGGFFVLSSLLSRAGKRRAAALDAVSEKGSVRDAGQVLANGGVAWACLVAFPGASLWAWTGAFAAAAADTWATEIGTLAGQSPRMVTTGRRVAPGTSGGVTVAGTLGAAAGALVVGLLAGSGMAGGVGSTVGAGISAAAPLALAAGLTGAFLDSLLGATVQARYRRADGHATERASERGPDGQPIANVWAGGWRWMTNDRVNLACTVAGALVGWAMGA